MTATALRRTVVLAGGGSGGHLSPGLAIAERLLEIDASARPLFLCSTRAIDAQMLGDAGAEFRPVPAEGLSMRPAGLLRFVRGYLRGRSEARRILQAERAEHVVSLGGFVTGPVVAAARSLGIPVTLVNLDATPGRANRMVARKAQRILSAVPTPDMPQFAEAIVGMPLRRAAMAPAGRAECRVELGLEPTRPVLLVTGASQGASSLNAFMVAFALANRALLESWQILHLAGPRSEPSATELEQAYARAGVRARVLPFLNRMGLAWGAAELALSRAGANSVAEAEANRVPAIFVPYPFHKDLHQVANAKPVVDAGGAVLAYDQLEVAANLRSIGEPLAALLADGRLRDRMEEALRDRAVPDAADAIARTVLGVRGRVSH
ncbi:MAG: UDP-N-acetylglucosamine--N-acetylmuramyl-(pentapeptide) pyrophosphoryl-undecaprenol N-acetylglucosamine transferase [Phycisphaerales bacterium]